MPSDEQAEASEAIRAYRAWALDPSGVAPPSIDPGPAEAEARGVRGTARVLRAEAQPWNQWGDEARPLLFNDRVALLVEVQVHGDGVTRWVPGRTVLEVNDPEHRLVALPTAEHLLSDLAWHALLQEKWVLDGDLVQRTRHAGPFREAFLHQEDDALTGVLAFRRAEPDVAVGALRLTLGLTLDDEPTELVWVFQ